jgi:hypothetical protein
MLKSFALKSFALKSFNSLVDCVRAFASGYEASADRLVNDVSDALGKKDFLRLVEDARLAAASRANRLSGGRSAAA